MTRAKAATKNDRRASVHLGPQIRGEMLAEAQRLDRSLSWLIQRLWRIGCAQIRAMPAPPSIDSEQQDGGAEGC